VGRELTARELLFVHANCQVRAATSAVVQSWWLDAACAARLFRRTAERTEYHQRRNAQARESHIKTAKQKLRHPTWVYLNESRWASSGSGNADGGVGARRLATTGTGPTERENGDGVLVQGALTTVVGKRRRESLYSDGSGSLRPGLRPGGGEMSYNSSR
jgi:hypothetical protein